MVAYWSSSKGGEFHGWFHGGETLARCEVAKRWEGYEVLSETWYQTGTYTHYIGNYCLHILFAMMLGNRIRSPMLGFLSATWPNGLFAPAASQTNRCTSNLGVVVIGDILSSMTWLLPGGGKIKPHQCMASISKSLWVGRSCFIQLLYAIMLTSCCKLCKALKHCYALAQNWDLWISRHQKLQLQDSRDL